ncbi:Epsin-1 [Eumeta japonica]|uniref:Epsin-1 n=1 Tax=Eumeta variegata TaxID=151549 RepID=A0A4C2AFS9_EUMVA|nr:Epsin-1 [Eumeta japonica]
MQAHVATFRRNFKNIAHNYSDAQVKVREATSNDPWGPSATKMAEIAELTNNIVAFSEIMKMIWKRLDDHGKERFAQYPSGFGSDGYIDAPTHRDMRDMPPGWQEEPPKPVSELEMVRPQTAGEEELQLQLAMAMSREEAEQEEAKRRSDDVRLQLALSQSEQDFKVQKQHKEEPQSHLLDLLDIQLGATSISSSPLGLAAGGLSHNRADPWITPARAASQMSDPWTGTGSPPVDPWQPSVGSRSTPLSSVQMGAAGGLEQNGKYGACQSSNTLAAAADVPADPWLSENLKPNITALPSQSKPAEMILGRPKLSLQLTKILGKTLKITPQLSLSTRFFQSTAYRHAGKLGKNNYKGACLDVAGVRIKGS